MRTIKRDSAYVAELRDAATVFELLPRCFETTLKSAPQRTQHAVIPAVLPPQHQLKPIRFDGRQLHIKAPMLFSHS